MNVQGADNYMVYMNRCLSLASKGLGSTGTNPMVGAVIVHESIIIGEAYHRKYGGAHAEVHAIESVKNKDLLKKSTLYVNLEPCSHHGKTPPCSDLIIRSGIPHVVIGTKDPNSLVAGKGIEKMTEAGCKVELGIMEEECRFLNRRFFTFHEMKRPYIILKWAQSADGFIDIIRDQKTKIGPHWISGPYERIMVHKWRSEESTILVGTNTAEKDNPALNVRYWSGTSPTRLIIDKRLRLATDLKIFNKEAHTIIFNYIKSLESKSPGYVQINKEDTFWPQIMDYLYGEEFVSLFIEGGAVTINSLLASGLWDEARIFIGDQEFHRGVRAPGPIQGKSYDYKTPGANLRIMYKYSSFELRINRNNVENA
ncbi:MAG: bifunctional diaminohydroxyphosphoribosylaminopyrimidine deaminase/5-amino-6-(5-phosphoribosylamino)uracil reductase RibD [Bacteroidota bacterium]|nr:bifunctional diaminohydroxyphosphoribosylaminopyrimidine deaminase/5-amino-6-(5-phosphoribosylamino)uracil reductase RibD [Bacteroidota bacterium]